LHSWREFALLDLLIFSTKTFAAHRNSAVVDRGERTREARRSHDLKRDHARNRGRNFTSTGRARGIGSNRPQGTLLVQPFTAGNEITLMLDMLRLNYDFLTIADIACWCICFWWMHRISSRQDAVLDQLRKQAERIENISKEQHAILTEVHPNVESIQKTVDEVSDDVAHVKGKVEKQN